jgi:hypothetical protein
LRSSLFPVLKRHGIEIHSERGRNIIRHIEGKAPRNPGGYLESILQRKPDFDPSDGEQPDRQTDAQRGPQAVGDMLRRAGYGPRGEEQ